MKIWLCISATAAMLGIAACGSAPAIVGKWGTGLDDCTPERAVEFTSDGRVTQVGRQIGTWVARGDDIAVDKNGNATKGRVSGNELRLGSIAYDRCPS